MTTSCEALREATGDCRILVLAATDLEATPLREALMHPRRFTVATKTLYVGEVAGHERPDRRTREAGPSGKRVALAVGGCDKTNTAVILTCLLQAMVPLPGLVLQVGIGGAFAGVGSAKDIRPGDVVIATQEAYSDTGCSSSHGWIAAAELDLPIAEVEGIELGGVFPVEPRLVERTMDVLVAAGFNEASGGASGGVSDDRGARGGPAVWQGPCVTSSTVTGRDDEAKLIAERWGALVESMEGAAAAHVCALYGVPFLEVRGISNLVGDRDRSTWSVGEAVEAAGRAALALMAVGIDEAGE